MKWLFFLLSSIVCIFLPVKILAAAKDEGYIYTQDRYFYQNGKKLGILGATFYPSFQINGQGGTLRSSAWLRSEFPTYIKQIVDQAASAGLNTLRPTDQMSDTNDPYNPTLWSNMDYLFTYAESKGMMVILDLSTYRNMLRKQGIMPYDSTKWKDFIPFVVNRYHTRKNLLYISIAGEVEAPTGTAPLRTTTANLTKFYDEVSTQIYTVDQGKHVIQSGGLLFLNFNSGIDWQTIFSLPHIMLASIHSYSDGDRNVTIPTVSAWAAQHNIAFTIDEFGFKQSLGDTTRAQSFTNTFHLVKQYSIASTILWNLGPEVKSDGDTYDVWTTSPQTWQAIKNFASELLTTLPTTTVNTPTTVPKLGDANGDRVVNGQDYIVWFNHYNQTTSVGVSVGDFNKSGKIDGADYVLWLTNYLH